MKIYKSEKFIPKGKSIGLFAHEMKDRLPENEHGHDFIEIVFVTGGEALQSINGKEYSVRGGDVLFINYGAVHSFVPVGDFSYVNVCFMPELLMEKITGENALALLSFTAFDELCESGNGGVIRFLGKERACVEFILKEMLFEQEKGDTPSQKIIENYFNVLLEKMLRKTRVSDATENDNDAWEQLTEHINDNLSDKLTLADLAKKSFYNPSYLSRAFKQRYGVTLTEYIAKKRVEKAITLLKIGNASVEEICEEVGFSDRSAFYHAFDKYAGCSPKTFREKK